MSLPGWSEDRVERLKALWADGLSASQVAKQLGGVTRNAVIGKVHRLGLAGRAAGGRIARPRPACSPRPRRPAAPRVAPRAPMIAAPVAAPAPAPEGPGLIASMSDLCGHLCKWPIGDPKSADFSFCGRPKDGAGPYCAGHGAAAFRPGKRALLAKDPLIRRVLAGLAA
ncbi:MAG: GcrA cell cycle regulator [Phenylobacterium zucineum]|nr:MAG: GcrA cell cycle regulator [Phenylobacterium zucineum]